MLTEQEGRNEEEDVLGPRRGEPEKSRQDGERRAGERW
jgi:hypothetical protein